MLGHQAGPPSAWSYAVIRERGGFAASLSFRAPSERSASDRSGSSHASRRVSPAPGTLGLDLDLWPFSHSSGGSTLALGQGAKD